MLISKRENFVTSNIRLTASFLLLTWSAMWMPPVIFAQGNMPTEQKTKQALKKPTKDSTNKKQRGNTKSKQKSGKDNPKQIKASVYTPVSCAPDVMVVDASPTGTTDPISPPITLSIPVTETEGTPLTRFGSDFYRQNNIDTKRAIPATFRLQVFEVIEKANSGGVTRFVARSRNDVRDEWQYENGTGNFVDWDPDGVPIQVNSTTTQTLKVAIKRKNGNKAKNYVFIVENGLTIERYSSATIRTLE